LEKEQNVTLVILRDVLEQRLDCGNSVTHWWKSWLLHLHCTTSASLMTGTNDNVFRHPAFEPLWKVFAVASWPYRQNTAWTATVPDQSSNVAAKKQQSRLNCVSERLGAQKKDNHHHNKHFSLLTMFPVTEYKPNMYAS
jgi:hypothetical protein